MEIYSRNREKKRQKDGETQKQRETEIDRCKDGKKKHIEIERRRNNFEEKYKDKKRLN